MKILVLIIGIIVAVFVGVYAYYLTLPRLSLLVYPDSKITGCKLRQNETVILHVRNDGTVNLYVNACNIYADFGVEITYLFQSDIVIPVGVEVVIDFPAGGGEVAMETVSGPSGTVAGGGVYAVSDSPDPNPFITLGQGQLTIYTRSGRIGGGEAIHIALS